MVPNWAGQSPYLVNIVQLGTSNSYEDIAHLIIPHTRLRGVKFSCFFPRGFPGSRIYTTRMHSPCNWNEIDHAQVTGLRRSNGAFNFQVQLTRSRLNRFIQSSSKVMIPLLVTSAQAIMRLYTSNDINSCRKE